MSPELVSTVYTILGVIIGGLIVAAISGNVVMYRQVGVLNQSVNDLTQIVKDLVLTHQEATKQGAESRATIHTALAELERQMKDVQARVGTLKERGLELWPRS
jgi:hypothetical protein